MFRNTGANAFAKNQMRLAYEDKRDLYCIRYLAFMCPSSCLETNYVLSTHLTISCQNKKKKYYFVCTLPIQVRNNTPNSPDRCKLYDERTPFI